MVAPDAITARDADEMLRIAERIEIGLELIANETETAGEFLVRAFEFVDKSFALPPSAPGGG